MQEKEKDTVVPSNKSTDATVEQPEAAADEAAALVDTEDAARDTALPQAEDVPPTLDAPSTAADAEQIEDESIEGKDAEPVEEKDAEEKQAADLEKPSITAPAGILLKKSHLVVCLILAVALIAGGFALGFHFSTHSDSGLRIDPNAHSYDNVHALPSGSENGISIPMFDKVIFPAEEREVQIVLLNPQGNACYFRYTLQLRESGEVLYQSGLIRPGMAVTDITLSRALPLGEYALQIVVETFSLTDELTPMNGTKTEVTLYCR